MDAGHAIADLLEVSSQVDAAVLVGPSGGMEASSLSAERAQRLADAARRLLDGAAAAGSRELTQLQAATREGSVYVARDGGWTVAATTGPDATVGLVFYDLRTCLRSLAQEQPEAARKPRRRRAAPEPAPDPVAEQEGADAADAAGGDDDATA